ncbi:CoA transferase [Oceanobacillus profundus]|uniref:CaiB/BaiF CoA transferase family protein n=1 Tax=Oceanobacillus TaxID=182709 RepID=UPI0026E3DF60|nr:CoA transferase [Oceanobacillus profundus]MDO6448647.1 CoA transferase [Oceanobacillus profundus]
MVLQAIRVLDLTRLLPGPYCTLMLADFGAEVIKVEDPVAGDYLRDFEPKLDADSAVFHSLNRNKKSICLDLKTEKERSHFLKLVETADVVMESFRPGVMKRLGLDYETLKQINPRLIYCAITGYGQTGPYKDKPGHDINYLSYAGLLHVMGEKDRKPVIPATQIADIGGGAYPAIAGILLALFEREKTGKGQLVDVSMLDGVVSWMHMLLPNAFAEREVTRGEELLNGGFACYQVYETKDNRFLSMGGIEQKFWKVFCEGIERQDFIDCLDAPKEKQEQMIHETQTIIARKTLEEWLDIFSEKEACVTPVKIMEETLEDSQLQAREMIQTIAHPELGNMKQIGNPIKLSESPKETFLPAPKRGEHTELILREIGVLN